MGKHPGAVNISSRTSGTTPVTRVGAADVAMPAAPASCTRGRATPRMA
jgi:hypothetical protein